MATMEQKKASRRQAKRVKARAAFKEKVATRRQDAPPDIRRNTHVEKGRIVNLNDIRPYARRGCSRCRRNPGVTNIVKNAEGGIVGAEPCKCAHTRFMKAHPEVIVEADGRAWWPAALEAAPFYQQIADAGAAVEHRATRPPEPGETDPG